jgi:phage tail sheath protein FI
MADETPGVYIEEISSFPLVVAQAETVTPAFISCTEIARREDDDDLHLTPTKIASMGITSNILAARSLVTVICVKPGILLISLKTAVVP